MAANATIITLPSDYAPAYNPVIVTASSTNTAEPNFRYIVQLVFTYPVSVTKTIKMSARPDGFLLFDAHRIIENYLSFDFNIGEATDSDVCDNSYCVCDIQIGVEYGSTPTEYLALDSTTALNFVNASLKHSAASFGNEPAFIDWDATEYKLNGVSTTHKFLTASPRNITICTDKNYYLYAFMRAATGKLRLRVYDSAGALLSTNFKTFTTFQPIFRVGVGTKNITAWNAAYLVGAGSYDVTIFTNPGIGSPDQLSEVFTFTIDCECSKFTEHFRLHFLNPLGGFDAFSFNMRYDRDINIKKANYTKILGSMSGGGAYTYAESQAGKVTFDARATENIKINSGNITEEESAWLFHICKSTQVFWEIDSSTYAPVIIKDTQYKPKVYAAQKLFNLELTIEISNEILSQRQ